MNPTLSAPGLTPTATLYYRAGASDKVYQAAVERRGDGYVVTVSYGRRGGTMSTGTKTASPLPYEAAVKIYEKLIREKMAKGYTPGETGTPYSGTERAGRSTCVLPQLLNPVEEAEAEALIADHDWWAQQKFDGRRVMVLKVGSEITGINRNGLTIALPAPVAGAVLQISAERCLLDGEMVGEVYHCFDLLNRDDEDLRDQSYAARYDAALDLVDAVPLDVLLYAQTAVTPRQKRELLDRLKRQQAEGIVFKHRLAPYTHGRPAVDGPQRKLKFTATASCRVAAVNSRRRSVAVELSDGGRWVGVGNVSVPANYPVPARGDIVEIRYLYAYRGGSLYQPVYLGQRDDLNVADCAVAQLKFKPDGESEAA